MAEFEAFLLASRLGVHLTTAGYLLSFRPIGHRYRFWVSVAAMLMAGTSLGLAAQIVTRWDELMRAGPQPWLVVFCGTVLFAVACSRGNIARWIEPFRRA